MVGSLAGVISNAAAVLDWPSEAFISLTLLEDVLAPSFTIPASTQVAAFSTIAALFAKGSATNSRLSHSLLRKDGFSEIIIP